MCSIRSTYHPGSSRLTSNATLSRSEPSTRAKTVSTSATFACVMKFLRPEITQESPSRRARVCSAAASEPAPGSLSANEQSHSPDASLGRKVSFCSSVPNSAIGPAPSDWFPSTIPELEQTRVISSQTMARVSSVPSIPPYSGGTTVANTSFSSDTR